MLQVNTEFRDMLEHFKQRVAGDAGEICSSIQPLDVPCDFCQGIKHTAKKSCLVCLASYCSTHLQQYHTAQALKWHELIDPVKTLAERVCKKHNKMMEYFCREDQSCFCAVCWRDDHMRHETVPLQQEFKERKSKLRLMKKQANHTLYRKCVIVQKIESLIN